MRSQQKYTVFCRPALSNQKESTLFFNQNLTSNYIVKYDKLKLKSHVHKCIFPLSVLQYLNFKNSVYLYQQIPLAVIDFWKWSSMTGISPLSQALVQLHKILQTEKYVFSVLFKLKEEYINIPELIAKFIYMHLYYLPTHAIVRRNYK